MSYSQTFSGVYYIAKPRALGLGELQKQFHKNESHYSLSLRSPNEELMVLERKKETKLTNYTKVLGI